MRKPFFFNLFTFVWGNLSETFTASLLINKIILLLINLIKLIKTFLFFVLFTLIIVMLIKVNDLIFFSK